ncbi:MAG TPA: hypothetical protein PLU85_02065 [Bacteroidia bacterium]|nr:hypothetical protein [Bacteroidia bacterium]QQR95524.1 MAG: hypothetical protein IPJ93_01850 [Bacteroidota bacterium]MBP7715050.1 hypothetical protein [Bacteroidia bacterium]MBP8669507.1 hypothetical protein [Bacteroidia bacterium]HOZ83507.1 hypothetical protein [Bacteroidia bacterium]
MTNYKNLIYALLCLSFSIIVGGSLFEHIAVWPNAFAAPPKSLTMFQGEYAFNPEPFWKSIHPVTLILFIITLIISWNTTRKKNVLIAFMGYVVILIATFIYYLPELKDLIATPFADLINQDLVQRGARWQTLSLFRTALAIILALILYFGLSKSDNKLS